MENSQRFYWVLENMHAQTKDQTYSYLISRKKTKPDFFLSHFRTSKIALEYLKLIFRAEAAVLSNVKWNICQLLQLFLEVKSFRA